ncbi:MAG TPA: hypothetical protein VFA51_07145 [Candidatus Udaeobacter sp.]|nr:hypothetical protein [Candidatus Udaeobacter sp.]
MKNSLKLSALCFTMVSILGLPKPACAGSHNLDEDAALTLLERTLKHDGVYTNRISMKCLTYQTEEATAAYFEFVLRELHNRTCGGDPDTNPVVDRYRIYRQSGRIEWMDRVEDKWQRYDPAKIRSD